jgi:SAM-dependent methyltransferase
MNALPGTRALTETPACPSCGLEDVPPPLFFESSTHSAGQVLGLSRCPFCSLYFTRPRLVDHNVSTRHSLYEAIVEKYGEYARSGRFHKNPNYRYYLEHAEELLERHGRTRPFSVLDIGSHCGFFLRFAAGRGWRVQGIEPAPPLVRFAREVNGVERIEEGFFGPNSYPGERFDLVTMFDVLEHIPQPVELLASVRDKLQAGGLVIAKVPHVRFYLRWRTPVAWLGKLGALPRYATFPTEPPSSQRVSPVPGFFDLFEHVVHYDANGVATVFGRAGFDRWKLLPAPPTNPEGHELNLYRTAVFQLSKLLHSLGLPPGGMTHGLVILAWNER